MDLQTATNIMRQGYCLWVGMGVTGHLASVGDEDTPNWRDLVTKMEAVADIESPNSKLTAPERLEIVRHVLGSTKFQRHLRAELLNPVSISVVKAARLAIGQADLVPMPVRQLGRLGALANPIVNFNIETLSSHALAAPGGPYEIKAFNPPVPGTVETWISQGSEDRERYQRCVYHPHGAINMYGISIITASQYGSLEGTLAYEIAVHAAFMSFLVIVGMSLEDAYLREQLARFRPQIKKVVWFCLKEPTGEIGDWARLHAIDVVSVGDWRIFWDNVVSTLHEPDELSQVRAWQAVVYQAFHGCGRRGIHADALVEFEQSGMSQAALAKHHQLAVNCGEDVDSRDADPFSETDRNEITRAFLRRIAELAR